MNLPELTVREVADRLIRELGMPPTPIGPWVLPAGGVELDVRNRDGIPVVQFFDTTNRVALRFVEVRTRDQLEFLVSWLRSLLSPSPSAASGLQTRG